jgi:hypothetical protein
MSLEEILAEAAGSEDQSEQGNTPGYNTSPFGSFNLGGRALLAERWTKHWDENYQTYYYVDNLNGSSQWTVPDGFVDDALDMEDEDDLIYAMYEPGHSAKGKVEQLYASGAFADYQAEEFAEEAAAGAGKEKAEGARAGAGAGAGIAADGRCRSPMLSNLGKQISICSLGTDDSAPPSGTRPPTMLGAAGRRGTHSSVATDDSSAAGFALYESDDVAEGGGGAGIAIPPAPGNDRDKTNQDYLALAKQYAMERAFSDPAATAKCVMCHRHEAQDVFFPCMHHCVCRKCIEKEKICTESDMLERPDGYCFCSICAASIRRIIPAQGGAEEQQYWDWVYQDKVTMSRDFMKRWRHSAGVIEVVFVEENRKRRLGISDEEPSTCVLS